MSTEISVVFLKSDGETEVRFCRGCSSPYRGEYWSHYLERVMTARETREQSEENGDYEFLRWLHGESFESKSLHEAVERAELVIFLIFDKAERCIEIKGFPCDDYPHNWVRKEREHGEREHGPATPLT